MPKYFKTVSTSVDSDTHKRFKDYCDKKKTSPHMVLKEHILEVLKENEQKAREEGSSDGGTERGRPRTVKVSY